MNKKQIRNINWFWIAFILVLLIGMITAIITNEPSLFGDAIFLAILMGLGKFLLTKSKGEKTG